MWIICFDNDLHAENIIGKKTNLNKKSIEIFTQTKELTKNQLHFENSLDTHNFWKDNILKLKKKHRKMQ